MLNNPTIQPLGAIGWLAGLFRHFRVGSEIMHTIGPWRVGDRFNTVFGPRTDAPSPEVIASVSRGDRHNAWLLAAAPELLAVCKQLLSELESRTAHIETCNMDDGELAAMGAAEKIIARAEGRIA